MITERINKIFQFIDFLHSNIDEFKQYNELEFKLKRLNSRLSRINKNSSKQSKIEHDEIRDLIKPIHQEVYCVKTEKIKIITNELGIYDWEENDVVYENLNDILNYLESFKNSKYSNEEADLIEAYKSKYLQYRKEVFNSYQTSQFFYHFDELLLKLFTYFSKNCKNEFESFSRIETTERIKIIFQFIDFLHSNIDEFKQYDAIINEIDKLCRDNSKLDDSYYLDELKRKKNNKLKAEKFDVINKNIMLKIKDKIQKLDFSVYGDSSSIWNYNIDAVNDLLSNLDIEDTETILNYKNKYIDYRQKINHNYFDDVFFRNLDELMFELFSKFMDKGKNEFESFYIIETNESKEKPQPILITPKTKGNSVNTLTNLYDRLMVKGFIDSNSNLNDFNKLFNGKYIYSNFNKVNWIQTHGSLKLFLKRLPKGYFQKPIVENCFLLNGELTIWRDRTKGLSGHTHPSKTDENIINELFSGLDEIELLNSFKLIQK